MPCSALPSALLPPACSVACVSLHRDNHSPQTAHLAWGASVGQHGLGPPASVHGPGTPCPAGCEDDLKDHWADPEAGEHLSAP